MFLQIGSIDFWIVLLAAASLLTAVVYVTILKGRMRRERRHVTVVSATIIDYFRRSGVEVSVGSVSLQGNKRFTAFIESEPMKRFRLSSVRSRAASGLVKRSGRHARSWPALILSRNAGVPFVIGSRFNPRPVFLRRSAGTISKRCRMTMASQCLLRRLPLDSLPCRTLQIILKGGRF